METKGYKKIFYLPDWQNYHTLIIKSENTAKGACFFFESWAPFWPTIDLTPWNIIHDSWVIYLINLIRYIQILKHWIKMFVKKSIPIKVRLYTYWSESAYLSAKNRHINNWYEPHMSFLKKRSSHHRSVILPPTGNPRYKNHWNAKKCSVEFIQKSLTPMGFTPPPGHPPIARIL